MSSKQEHWRKVVRGERGGLSAFFLRRMLWLARLPYAIGVRTRNRLFDTGWKKTHVASVPVVSVGNLTLGGTGKTPCVEYIARFYRELEVQVAILSRGYGSAEGRNDEAMLLEENLPDVPHLQGADRVVLAETAVEELESELLILDDGFQHRRIGRDLNIVLIDMSEPIARDYLFPRGTLREPLSSLKRANIVMLTRGDRAKPEAMVPTKELIRRYTPHVEIVVTKHEPLELIGTENRKESVELLRNRPVAAFCGIGNPEAFRQTLIDLGARITDFKIYPDHHPYTREDVDQLRQWAEKQPADTWIITTQKDFVKLRIPELSQRPLWAVRIGLGFIEGRDRFDERLRGVMNAEDLSSEAEA